ncbi:MAG: hypothetical protein F4Y49_08750 [Dehalococcoidia bacterium]|nr:hypothetical protein [Dehalococcoidia bacterium]MYA62689.1 hypothetical protein [Dehalococcoidia bacterium]
MRIYSSTLYILLTSLRVGFDPMEGDGRYGFQPPQSGNRAAHVEHFNSAVYMARCRINLADLDIRVTRPGSMYALTFTG